MSINEKRKVTFDPDPLPSSEASPPVLPFAHFPAIVSKNELQDVTDPTVFKSILKNPPSTGKAYDSLCNFLIDLPPPLEIGLLSLDVLQTETVFKPKQRYNSLKNEPRKLPIFEEGSSSEDDSEDDSITEYHVTEGLDENEKPNFEDTLNEDDLLYDQSSTKPKSFEASLLMEQTADDRLGLDSFQDITPGTSPDILPSIESPFISEINLNLSYAPSEIDVEFTDLSGELESEFQLQPVVEDIIVPENFVTQTEVPMLDSPIEFHNGIDIRSWPVENLPEESMNKVNDTLDRRWQEEVEEKETSNTYIPNYELENKVEQYNPNIRKLDEEHNDLLDDFKIVNKKNKISDSNSDKDVQNLIDTIDRIVPVPVIQNLSTTVDEDIAADNNLNIQHSISPDDKDIVSVDVASDISFLKESVKSEIVSNIVESLRVDEIDLKANTSITLTQLELPYISTTTTPETSVTTIQDNTDLNNNSNIATREVLQVTSSATTLAESSAPVPESAESADPATGADDAQSTTGGRQRRKSGGRKGHHRKHSHSSRTAAATQQQNDTNADNNTNNNMNDNNIDQSVAPVSYEQKSLDAQARLKRYLTKMAAKSVNENQNLNCAGEPETLEPQMRDSITESQVLIWIYNMIDEAARVDFEFFLKDGCILCKLMNRVVPGSIPESEITWEGARSKQKNINNFLREAEKYGVPKAKLFFSEDLLHLRHVPRVTRCIYALAKIAQTDASFGHDMPQLRDEPSFLKEASKSVQVPGHRNTRAVLAQLTASKDENTAKKTKHSLYK